MGKWYAGVVHSHTNRSDGKYTPEELIKLAEEKGLDFIIITDHNRFCDVIPHSDKLLVIPGTELTTESGHTNIWGVTEPIDNFDCPDYDEWNRKIAMAREKGAYICINHPWCGQCTWRWPLEAEKADCVELWNSPQHTDNMTCTSWWQSELAKGKKIPAVGGSDFHRNYFVTDFLANPTTYVYCENCTQEEILEAIKAGRTTITPNVGKTMITMTSGNCMIGDTVKLDDDTKITVKVSMLKKNHTLKVIGKNGSIFSFTARKNGPFSVTLPVKDTNFICAQIEYDVSPLFELVYKNAIGLIVPAQKGQPVPPFIYAQTGAVYFE